MARKTIAKNVQDKLVFQIAVARMKNEKRSPEMADAVEDAIFDTLSNVGFGEEALAGLVAEVERITGE